MTRAIVALVLASSFITRASRSQAFVRPDPARATATFGSLTATAGVLRALDTFPAARESGPLRDYISNPGFSSFNDAALTRLASARTVEDGRKMLRERADAIRSVLDDVRRGYRAGSALKGPPTSDSAVLKAIAHADSLAAAYDSLAFVLPPARLGTWWPVLLRSEPQARCYWGHANHQTLASSVLAFSKERGAIGVDFVEDYVGGVRMTFGGALSATNSQDSTQANLSRFMAAGGNANLAFSYALVSLVTVPLTCDPEDKPPAHRADASFQVELQPRLGFDVPAIGTRVDHVSYNVDLGLEMRATLAGSTRAIALVARFRPAFVFGSPTFYDGIAMSAHHPFGYGLLTVGIAFGAKVSVTASLPVFAPDSLKDGMKGVFSVGLRQ